MDIVEIKDNPFESSVDPIYLIVQKRLDALRRSVRVIPWNDYSRLLFINDLHCGLGKDSHKDDFYKNSALCLDTIRDFKGKGFQIIGSGDIADLWENPYVFWRIRDTYKYLFKILDSGLLLRGNHDWELSGDEAILLRHTHTGQEILVCHGHQGDLWNDELWQVGKWVTQHWGEVQEQLGISDPTGWKIRKHEMQEEKLIQWAEENIDLICGHTHRPLNMGKFHNGGSWVGNCGQATIIEDGQIEVKTFN